MTLHGDVGETFSVFLSFFFFFFSFFLNETMLKREIKLYTCRMTGTPTTHVKY